MGTLGAIFEVPKFIELGLASGQYERIGGVIVESGSKQIVAWLRESNNVGNIINSVIGNVNPLKLVFQAADTALKLYDGHMTREVVETLSQSVQANHLEVMNALSATQQSIHSLMSITMLTSAGQIVNLAVSGATFAIIMKRLDRLSAEIEALQRLIVAEFQRDRDIAFKKALQAARDSLEGTGKLKDSAARSAIDGLYSSREHFFEDFDKALGEEPNQDNFLVANQFLLRAIYAELSRIRCYLAGEDPQLALRRLREDMPLLQQRAQKLAKLWIGENNAPYFHKDVSPETLDRFLRIQLWLKGTNSQDTRAIFDIINESRDDFWNTRVLSQGGVLSNFKNGLPLLSKQESRDVLLSKNLAHVETLMENMNRLIGFDIEIRTMRLSLEEWDQLANQQDLDEYGAALILDDEIAEYQQEVIMNRLSMNDTLS